MTLHAEVDAGQREPRSPRMLRCEIVDPLGKAHPAILKNISRFGLGGSHCTGLEAGEQVTIVLPELGTLTGVVRWAGGGKFGIRLDDEIIPGKIRFIGAKNEAAPNFAVSHIHRPVEPTRRPGF